CTQTYFLFFEVRMGSLPRSPWGLAFVMAVLPLALHAGGPGKTPVPDKAAQEKALKLVLEVFQDDLQNAREPAARVKLAAELLQQGRETKDDLALRYVLLREAGNLAAEGGDAALAFSAIEEIGKAFALDVLA